MAESVDRQNLVSGELRETVGVLAGRIEGVSPGDVVRMGASEAADSIFDATQSRFENDGRASVRDARAKGLYR